MCKKIKYILLVLPILICSEIYSQNSSYKIYINELMASNVSTIKDPDFAQYSDWLEIYNAGDSTVQLQGSFLTDDLCEKFKWQIPVSVSIRSKEYAIFWADGQNERRHSNFKLSKEGEQIGLFAPDGSLIDTLSFSSQLPDISFGRLSNNLTQWRFFENPTPGKINSDIGFSGSLAPPLFSQKAGFYTGNQFVEIQSDNPDVNIRFTSDGSIPNENSQKYINPIRVDKTTVLRARCFKDNFISSPVVTKTYLINENIILPVVAIATEPENLWDDQTGIYVEGKNGVTGYCSNSPKNWNQDWEQPVHLEFFDQDKTLGLSLDAGMKIGGGCTRKYPQKSLAIYARSKYGESKIRYKIFPDKNITGFNNIVLRNFGQDFYRTLFRDFMMQALVKDRMNLDWQAFRASVVFVNGIYWCIHNIREKHNEHYFK